MNLLAFSFQDSSLWCAGVPVLGKGQFELMDFRDMENSVGGGEVGAEVDDGVEDELLMLALK
jgi:hypothetical protein